MKIQKYYYLSAFLLIGFLFCCIITIPNFSAKTFSIETDPLLKSSSNGDLIRYIDGIQVNEYTTGNQRSSSICHLSDNKVAIIWKGEGSGDDQGVFGTILNVTTGENLTTEFRVNTWTSGSQDNPSACVLSNESFVIAWEGEGVGDAEGIWARIFNATTGTSITSEFRVNNYTMGTQIYPSICALSNEIFAIAWQGAGVDDTNGIWASIFNATTGKNITSEFRVNDNITGGQNRPSIYALSNESFIISWWGEGTSDDFGIYASVFNATTVTNITSEFRVNNYTIGWQWWQSICVLSNDSFAITWQGSGVNDNDGIYARVFNATTGTNITSEFRANSYTSGSQILPSICPLSNESFIITWYGAGESDNNGIYASVFNATTGINITAEFRVNNYTSGDQSDPYICALSNETFAIIWSGEGASDDSGIFFSVFYTGTIDTSPEDGDNDDPPNDFGFYLFLFIIISLSFAIVAGSIYSIKKKKYKTINNSLQTKSGLRTAKRIKMTHPPLKTVDINQHKKIKGNASVTSIAGLSELEREELRKTESEVSVEKRDVICVVHKSSIKGAIYMCPKCDTYYCFKCAKMLSERGENCWVCDNEINLEGVNNEKL